MLVVCGRTARSPAGETTAAGRAEAPEGRFTHGGEPSKLVHLRPARGRYASRAGAPSATMGTEDRPMAGSPRWRSVCYHTRAGCVRMGPLPVGAAVAAEQPEPSAGPFTANTGRLRWRVLLRPARRRDYQLLGRRRLHLDPRRRPAERALRTDVDPGRGACMRVAHRFDPDVLGLRRSERRTGADGSWRVAIRSRRIRVPSTPTDPSGCAYRPERGLLG